MKGKRKLLKFLKKVEQYLKKCRLNISKFEFSTSVIATIGMILGGVYYFTDNRYVDINVTIKIVLGLVAYIAFDMIMERIGIFEDIKKC